MDDNNGTRAYRKKNKFGGEDKVNFGHMKFMVPEDHTRDFQAVGIMVRKLCKALGGRQSVERSASE